MAKPGFKAKLAGPRARAVDRMWPLWWQQEIGARVGEQGWSEEPVVCLVESPCEISLEDHEK